MDGLTRESAAAEQLIEAALPQRPAKPRLLIVVNPYATTVSARLKNLVVHALEGRYEVDAIDTDAPGHATLLCREAADEGYDAVVAFGGDGTVNEVANGLLGSSTALTCLPGGSTNVFCRTLGIPGDVVEATEHLLRLAGDFRPFRVGVGSVNGRAFVFSSGAGLDASVVRRVDRRPRLKAALGEYYFTYAALATFNRRYLVRPPRLRVEAGDRVFEGVSAVVQCSDPYTYFARRPIRLGEPRPGGSSLALTVLERLGPRRLPGLIARIFSADPARVRDHPSVVGADDLGRVSVTSADSRRLPVQIDGDYLGEFDRLDYSLRPGALTVVA